MFVLHNKAFLMEDNSSSDLTVGKIYEIVEEYDDSFEILDDKGVPHGFPVEDEKWFKTSDHFIVYTPELEVGMLCLKYHLNFHGKSDCLSLRSSIMKMITELNSIDSMTVHLHPMKDLESVYSDLGEDFFVEYVNAHLDNLS